MRLSHFTIEQASDAICWMDSAGQIYRANEAACKLLGYTEKQLTSMTIHDICTEYKEHGWSDYWEEMKNHRMIQYETFYSARDGSSIPVEIRANYMEFEEGEFICHFARDITQRKRMEQLLLKNQMNLAEAQRLANLGSWDWDIETQKIFWSDEMFRIYGINSEDFGGTYEAAIAPIHPEDRTQTEKAIKDAIKNKLPYNLEHRIVRPDGEERIVSAKGEVIYNEMNEPIRMVGTIQDITERKRIEELIIKQQANLAAAQKLAHLGSWEWDIEENDLFWSDEIYRIFGLSQNKFGATYEAFMSSVHPEDREYVQKAVDDALYNKRPYSIEHRIVLPNGNIRIVHESAEVNYNDLGKPTLMIGTVQDITDRKKAEEKLRDALKEVERLKSRLQQENIYLQEEIKLQHNFDEIISRNDTLKKSLRKVEQVAATNTSVLILGETGTGKELFARAIHHLSDRSGRPLVKVNCAALPANLIESELFGHEKGAFTGALEKKAGRFELADRGTIFLDEIGDLPIDLQAKFLRILESGEFERLGDPKTINVDVRVIAATNRDLSEAVNNKTFREDLFYRLNVFPINIIPLRERRGDIPVLVNYFVKKYSKKIGKNIETISRDAMKALQAYGWPGNVRELENVIERAVILAGSESLQFEDLPPNLSDHDHNRMPAETKKLDDIEKKHVLNTLEECNWVIGGKRGAAVRLGLPPSSLRDRMKKLGIQKPE